jgi:hypothetical protein
LISAARRKSSADNALSNELFMDGNVAAKVQKSIQDVKEFDRRELTVRILKDLEFSARI